MVVTEKNAFCLLSFILLSIPRWCSKWKPWDISYFMDLGTDSMSTCSCSVSTMCLQCVHVQCLQCVYSVFISNVYNIYNVFIFSVYNDVHIQCLHIQVLYKCVSLHLKLEPWTCWVKKGGWYFSSLPGLPIAGSQGQESGATPLADSFDMQNQAPGLDDSHRPNIDSKSGFNISGANIVLICKVKKNAVFCRKLVITCFR